MIDGIGVVYVENETQSSRPIETSMICTKTIQDNIMTDRIDLVDTKTKIELLGPI